MNDILASQSLFAALGRISNWVTGGSNTDLSYLTTGLQPGHFDRITYEIMSDTQALLEAVFGTGNHEHYDWIANGLDTATSQLVPALSGNSFKIQRLLDFPRRGHRA